MGAQQLRFGLLEPPNRSALTHQQTPFTGRQVCLTLQIGDELLVLALLEESLNAALDAFSDVRPMPS
ncbi:hypothetical protein BXU09_18485 [Deinococcus sp. LM3]|nr:hypothetical protein BXU09_18485 [Deinococcus sp. LM3]